MATPLSPASRPDTHDAPLPPIERPPYRMLGLHRRLGRFMRRLNPRQVALLILAAAVGLIVSTSVRRARETTEQLGQTAPVVVVVQSVAAGADLTTANTETRSWPVAFIPDGALAALDSGAVAMHPLAPGEVVTSQRTTGRSGLAADENAVLVPTPFPRDDLTQGDRVALYALEPIGSGDQIVAAAARLLGVGRVVESAEQATGVALPVSLVAPTLEAMAIGVVELVELPG